MRKKLLTIVLTLLCIFMLNGCGASTISGTYSSEDGKYSIEFSSDSECTWYQDGTFFNGTYKKTENGYQLEIVGKGLYSNTVFSVDIDEDDIIVSGGKVEQERFTKE